jgi:hypothetical protein
VPISSRPGSTDAEDLDLIARGVGLVVLQWGQAEQSLELLVASLWQSFSGHRFAKRIPVLLVPKVSFVRACIAGTSALKPLESRVLSLLAEFERLSALRHDLIHGAPASIAAVDGHFVFVRLNVQDGFHHTREVRIPIEQYPKLVDSLVALGSEAHQVAHEVFEVSKKLDLTPLRPAQ